MMVGTARQPMAHWARMTARAPKPKRPLSPLIGLIFVGLGLAWTSGCSGLVGDAQELVACLAGENRCGATCHDLTTDETNCGECGVICSIDEVCREGSCVERDCGLGRESCQGTCVNVDGDPQNCGACGAVCEPGQECVDGQCGVCLRGTLCQGQNGEECVVDLNASASHCAACGVACGVDEACIDGVCTLSCAPNETVCGQRCRDLQRDSNHCGACDQPCGVGALCVNGACSCAGDTLLCEGTCVDLQTDVVNCGACGITCPQGGACIDGICSCPEGTVDCGGVCTDVSSDALNCGQCNYACGSGGTCEASVCSCEAPSAQCGQLCIDVLNDPQNCGACNVTCAIGESCSMGLCLGADACYDVAVADIAIEEVAVYQAVKIALVERTEDRLSAVTIPASKPRPVVGRYGLFRVFVEPGPDWQAREISARLAITGPDPLAEPTLLYAKKTVTEASTDADPDSTFLIDVPPETMVDGARFQVSLVECTPTSTTTPTALTRFPETGFADLNAAVTGPMKLHLIPLRVGGEVPSLDPDIVDIYRNRLMAIFPVTDVVVTTGPEINGAGSMCDHLAVLRELRGIEDAPSDVYYYGVAPGPTGNTTGCSSLSSNPANANARVSAGWDRNNGQGYERGAATMAHELGHAHGRRHTPCGGPAGPDPNYPDPDADIVEWGYDFRNGSFKPPNRKDMMSYCPNPDRTQAWVGEYTYEALVDRVAAVNQLAELAQPAQAPWRLLMVINGTPRWYDNPILIRGTPSGQPLTAEILDERGTLITTAVVYREELADGEGINYMVTTPTLRPGWSAIRMSGLPTLSFDVR